jgi:hypothetical protein
MNTEINLSYTSRTEENKDNQISKATLLPAMMIHRFYFSIDLQIANSMSLRRKLNCTLKLTIEYITNYISILSALLCIQ